MYSRVLMIGGTGMLGLPVARQLQSDGFEVTIMTTNLERAQARLGDEFMLVEGNVTVPESLVEPIQNTEVVYLNLNAKHDPVLYESIEIRGTMNVAWTAKRQGAKRIMTISGASSEGIEKGTIYLDAKVRAERALMECGVPYTIMRPSWFFESLPFFIKNGRAVVLGRQPIPRAWLAVRDYARQVSAALKDDTAVNKCFYNLGPQKMTIMAAVQQFCARHHPDIKPSHTSFIMAKLAALLPGRPNLKSTIGFFEYFEKQPENGSADDADRILGPNLTTLEEWLDTYQPTEN